MGENTDKRGLSRRQRRKAKYTLTVIAAALAGAVIGSQALNPAFSKVMPKPLDAQITAKRDVTLPGGFAELIETVKPAVVNVSVSGKIGHIGRESGPQFEMPDLPFKAPPNSRLEEFFRHYFNKPNEEWQDKAPVGEVQAVGSGFIVDPSGYVVTNNHVIDGADKITVILHDGKRLAADVKGRDPKTDLALLRVKTKEPLPYVTFGDSDATRVGDWVLAIGNPFGLGGTATAGIVSARGRDINSGPYDDYIQIDAPINRGNSGGPLFDIHGKVIGVNTAIFSPNGGSVGIGFAIPATLANSVIEQLRAHGKVERGWFGVKIQTVTEDVAKGLGLKKPTGALVAEVVADGPAAKAGIRTGDVITEYNGRAVERMRDLPRLVAETKAKDKVSVKVWRNGEEHILAVVIASMPTDEVVAAAANEDGESGGKLGLSLAPITPEARQQYRLSEDSKGALIVGVRSDSPAAKKGLRAGDVIKMVGQKPVSAPKDVIDEVKKASVNKRDAVVLLVERNGDRRFVAIDLA